MEEIFIKQLKVFGHHGVYQHEKEEGQFFFVNALFETSFLEAAEADRLEKTTDYGNLCLFIKKFFDEKAFDLLETAANHLAISLLYSFPGVQKVQLSICKPDAPVPMEFEGLGVCVTKEWTTAAIGLGSNIGDRRMFLNQALEKLVALPAIRNLVVSDFIETEPYGNTNQERFYNGAAVFDTIYTPEELLELLHKLEAEAGRERKLHWGPRTLDLDILLYGNAVINQKRLVIPHIDMCNRMFVLKPLCQIAPGMVHPIRRRTVYDLYQMLDKTAGQESL